MSSRAILRKEVKLFSIMSKDNNRKVAVITGGNAGIGLALAKRLLKSDPDLHICLACRNKGRADAARDEILLTFPTADISIILLDVSSLKSVYMAAQQIKQKFDHIDYLYANAGIMPVSTVDWGHFWRCVFSKKCIEMFRTGDGVIRQEDGTTSDGLKQIFATNLFGHFVLIKELGDFLGGPDRTTQIIWTSSSNAKKEAFSIDDMQHKNKHEPYGSSKYLSDMLSVALNENFNERGVFSHTTCPGLVMTNLTYGILPAWFWYILFPIICLLRLFTPSMNYSADNGAEALFWLSQQSPAGLCPITKFYSRVSFLGKRYTTSIKMDVDMDLVRASYQKLCHLEAEMRRNNHQL